MLYYFTFPNFWNTHMLKTYASYKVNWDHKISISVSNELNQTGMLGKHLAHIKRLKFLGRVTMIGFLFLFYTPKVTFCGKFQRSGNLAGQWDAKVEDLHMRKFKCTWTHLSGIHIRQVASWSILQMDIIQTELPITQNYLTFYDHK